MNFHKRDTKRNWPFPLARHFGLVGLGGVGEGVARLIIIRILCCVILDYPVLLSITLGFSSVLPVLACGST